MCTIRNVSLTPGQKAGMQDCRLFVDLCWDIFRRAWNGESRSGIGIATATPVRSRATSASCCATATATVTATALLLLAPSDTACTAMHTPHYTPHPHAIVHPMCIQCASIVHPSCILGTKAAVLRLAVQMIKKVAYPGLQVR